MTVQVQRIPRIALFAQITPPAVIEIAEPSSAPQAPRGVRLLRSVSRRIWHILVIAISGPGLGEEYRTIDETAMPSGFMAPHKRGSRGVRNLWHQPF